MTTAATAGGQQRVHTQARRQAQARIFDSHGSLPTAGELELFQRSRGADVSSESSRAGRDLPEYLRWTRSRLGTPSSIHPGYWNLKRSSWVEASLSLMVSLRHPVQLALVCQL